jgi:hypothetical protein
MNDGVPPPAKGLLYSLVCGGLGVFTKSIMQVLNTTSIVNQSAFEKAFYARGTRVSQVQVFVRSQQRPTHPSSAHLRVS